MCIEMHYFTYHRGHLTREFVYVSLSFHLHCRKIGWHFCKDRFLSIRYLGKFE